MTKRNFKMFAAACAALVGTAPAVAGNAAAGNEKAKSCAACHGETGVSAAPDFPKIAGQHADYLVKALNDYKKGARKNPIMSAQAANLSRQDIEDLAAYFSNQQGGVAFKR